MANKSSVEEEIVIGYNNKKTSSKNNVKKRKRKWYKLKRVLLFLFKAILAIGVIAGICAFLFISPVFNIKEIKAKNALKISENTYIVLSGIEIGENIFKINKSKIKSLIEQEPYVEEVQIKREFPSTIVLEITERQPEYLIEKNGMYIYIDKNGYALETSSASFGLPILKGISTDIDSIEMGKRISDKDIEKLGDLIKIINGVQNNNIEAKISYIDISNRENYVLGFEAENKKVMFGDLSDMSTKMLWIKYFMEQHGNESGTIHLEGENVYFTPEA